jgi:truncated hemoglobin YjbI
LKKLERAIDWGTDSAAAKKGDYFQVKDVSLYDRLGGDEVVEVVATMLLDKTLREPAVAGVFDLADKPAVQLRLKSLLAMVFGGPYPYSAADLKAGAAPLALVPSQFDRILALLKETMRDLKIDTPLFASDLAWCLVRPAVKCTPEVCSVAESQCQSDFVVCKLRRAEIFQGDLGSKFV